MTGVTPIISHQGIFENPTTVYSETSDEMRVNYFKQFVTETKSPWFFHLHLVGTHYSTFKPKSQVFSMADQGRVASKKDIYNDAIWENDTYLKEAVDFLVSRGQLEETLVIISSDHTKNWHSDRRIPLLIRFPSSTIKGKINGNVQLA